MKWSSAVSDNITLSKAVAECAARIRQELGDQTPDLVVTFVSAHHVQGYGTVPQLVRDHLGECVILGCSGGGVIGAGQEVERRPGFAITAAVLPEVAIAPFHIEDDQLPDGDAPPDRWAELVGVTPGQSPCFVLLADPFSVRGDQLLMGLDFAFPGSVKIGGLASGANRPDGNALYLRDRAYASGAVGVALFGNIAVDTIVAQGCKPIGQPMHITACERNVLLELDGHTP
ncbi:MAG: FIST N-terminal domain-containing protein, partial [Ardenticatenaceae bacterium]